MNFRDIFLLFLTVMFTASAEAQNVPADSFKRFIEGQTFIEKAVFEVTEFMGLAPGKEPKRYFFLLRSEPGSYVLRGSKRLESLSNDQIQTSEYFFAVHGNQYIYLDLKNNFRYWQKTDQEEPSKNDPYNMIRSLGMHFTSYLFNLGIKDMGQFSIKWSKQNSFPFVSDIYGITKKAGTLKLDDQGRPKSVEIRSDYNGGISIHNVEFSKQSILPGIPTVITHKNGDFVEATITIRELKLADSKLPREMFLIDSILSNKGNSIIYYTNSERILVTDGIVKKITVPKTQEPVLSPKVIRFGFLVAVLIPTSFLIFAFTKKANLTNKIK